TARPSAGHSGTGWRRRRELARARRRCPWRAPPPEGSRWPRGSRHRRRARAGRRAVAGWAACASPPSRRSRTSHGRGRRPPPRGAASARPSAGDMSQTQQPTRYGRIRPPDEAWLAKAPAEAILEPALPIIDTHHHLWERPDHRYLLHELLADLRTGHHVVATVFLECHAMYRGGGPAEMRPVGETEFVAGIAAMSESGLYGPTRVAAGIV